MLSIIDFIDQCPGREYSRAEQQLTKQMCLEWREKKNPVGEICRKSE